MCLEYYYQDRSASYECHNGRFSVHFTPQFIDGKASNFVGRLSATYLKDAALSGTSQCFPIANW
ncbi:hypothetical protein PILCRDRAFT_818603 [Piloderma croceum F 1598]|uniref:Uncharacterized protein n=1 Tax=Piloderma croceum (strain F 1598) TaxID=765440 RepID=A0A0C3G0R1_PILCF|nr:hypothetical protein PILCRDRAFT_818603 [Piloderma croceum F 1598]